MNGPTLPQGQKSARRLDPLDTDYLAALEATDQLLSAILHEAMKYRSIVRVALPRLRAGADPGPVRASLEPWRRSLQTIKRLSRDL